MKINREWHETHKLPRNATLEQRIDWHLAHAANCGCRDIPPTIKRAMEERGLTVPTPQSLK
jgi:hypothetical protein